jgi:hypothetical protein
MHNMSEYFMKRARENYKMITGKEVTSYPIVWEETKKEINEDKTNSTSAQKRMDVVDLVNNPQNLELIKKGLVGNRNAWKENLVRSQGILMKYLKEADFQPGKQYVANELLKISDKVLRVAQEDLKRGNPSSENKLVRMVQRVYSNLDIADKKKFWMDVFETQQKTLDAVAHAKIDKDLELKALQNLVKYCNTLLYGLEQEQKSSVMSIKSIRGEAVSQIRQIREVEMKKNQGLGLKEVLDFGKIPKAPNFHKFGSFGEKSNL